MEKKELAEEAGGRKEVRGSSSLDMGDYRCLEASQDHPLPRESVSYHRLSNQKKQPLRKYKFYIIRANVRPIE